MAFLSTKHILEKGGLSGPLLDRLNQEFCNRLRPCLLRDITEANDKCNLVIDFHPQLALIRAAVEVSLIANPADSLILIKGLIVIHLQRGKNDIGELLVRRGVVD